MFYCISYTIWHYFIVSYAVKCKTILNTPPPSTRVEHETLTEQYAHEVVIK